LLQLPARIHLHQLAATRPAAGDLSLLLIYVPAALLDGGFYGYPTYEQLIATDTRGEPEAYFGATLIPVNSLLGTSGRWKSRKYKRSTRQAWIILVRNSTVAAFARAAGVSPGGME
jgi:hypothetical protein